MAEFASRFRPRESPQQFRGHLKLLRCKGYLRQGKYPVYKYLCLQYEFRRGIFWRRTTLMNTWAERHHNVPRQLSAAFSIPSLFTRNHFRPCYPLGSNPALHHEALHLRLSRTGILFAHNRSRSGPENPKRPCGGQTTTTLRRSCACSHPRTTTYRSCIGFVAFVYVFFFFLVLVLLRSGSRKRFGDGQ